MAVILTKETTNKIRELTSKQKELDPTYGTSKGWMCESCDSCQLTFFNNEFEYFFIVDYDMNILDFDLGDEFNFDFNNFGKLKEIVKLEIKKEQLVR